VSAVGPSKRAVGSELGNGEIVMIGLPIPNNNGSTREGPERNL
jgi:hypothetical protein